MVFRTYTENVLVAGDNLKDYVAEEAVLMGQVVEAGGADNSVEPADADGNLCVGVALYDAAVGERVTVALDGCLVRATDGAGDIDAGELVASHGSTGEEGEVAAAAMGDYYVGQARFDGEGDGSDVLIEVKIGGVI